LHAEKYHPEEVCQEDDFVVHSTDGSMRRSVENRAQADDALPV
jgi:hypothetical protein